MSRLMHETLAEAYRCGLRDILEAGAKVPSVRDPLSVASGFGKNDRPALELLGYSFEVLDPQAALLNVHARRIRLPYYIGLLSWTLSGADDVDSLAYYHPAAPRFSDDGFHLCGAFGKRLFDYRSSINQIDVITNRIKSDPSTRRAVASILAPEDNARQSREYPCAIAAQYFLRNDRLFSITYMRAQHALTVLPFDAFLFMALQCILAERLGVGLGTYQHFSGTFHIYDSEREDAEAILASPVTAVSVGSLDNIDARVKDVIAYEHALREAVQQRDVALIKRLAISGETHSFAARAKLILLSHAWAMAGAPHEFDQILANLEVSPDLSHLLGRG